MLDLYFQQQINFYMLLPTSTTLFSIIHAAEVIREILCAEYVHKLLRVKEW